MKKSPRTIFAVGLIAFLSAGSLCQQTQAAPITGNISWTGTVQLDTNSAATASMVITNGWGGPGGSPQVASRDGDFATFVNVGDNTTFASPWSFNTPPNAPISGFWAVDGFTFDLAMSSITGQGGTPGTSGFVLVTGTGTVSGNGFTPTVGTWRFSTQDPGAGNPQQFSFSASVAVPEAGTTALLVIGGACLAARILGRRKSKAE